MSIESLMDQMEAAHRERYATNSEELCPFIMLINKMGQIHTYLEVPMGDDRDATVRTIIDAVQTTQSPGFIFSSEAWMAEVENLDDAVPPSIDPKRQEVLIMEGNSRTETTTRVYDIVRDENGKVTDLKRKMMKGTRMHSRFDIFPRPKHDVP